MDELLRVAWVGYEGAKTKHVSTAFAPLARVASSKRKLSRKAREGREVEDAQRTSHGRERREKDVRIIRTKKDRTGSFEAPLQRACDVECRRRQRAAKLAKNTISDRTTTGYDAKQKKNTTLTL